nr:hypothetical protein [Tanacetum cinerariifolium]
MVTHGSVLNVRYDHSVRNIELRANKEVSRLIAELEVLKSKRQTAEHKLSSWDKKHRKYRNERDTLAMEKAKIEEELVGTKSQLEHRERKAKDIQDSIASFFHVGVERGLCMDHTDEEFIGLSQKVAGFILDAKEKFDRVIAAFPNTSFPFLDKVNLAKGIEVKARIMEALDYVHDAPFEIKREPFDSPIGEDSFTAEEGVEGEDRLLYYDK